MGFLQDVFGNDGMAGKKESKRRQSLNPGQKLEMSAETSKNTGKMLLFQAALVALTIFAYTGFGVSGWVEFTVRSGLSLDESGNLTRDARVGFDKTLILLADVNPDLTIDDIRLTQQKWFDDDYYFNKSTGLPKTTVVTNDEGDEVKVLGKDKHVFFRVMPAYQQATVVDVSRKSDDSRKYTEHKHKWQSTVTFRTSMWDEGTSCYNPYGEEDIGDNIDEANFDDYYPSDLGDIVHYYGNQYVPVLSDDVDSDGKYYIKYLRYSQSKCLYLYRSYFLGAAGMSFSVIAGFTSLLFSMLVYAHNPKKGYQPPPLNPRFKRGICAQVTYWCTAAWFFLKKRGPQIVGFTCAFATGAQGALSLISIAQMAGFHGHWYYFTMPWYVMGIVGFLDLYAFARMANIIHDFYVKGRRLRLQNVPEGLWARKVECGGPEGFKEETRLGMSLAKVGNEIVVTHVRGFAKTKGCLQDNEDEIGVSTYYANNVQEGDVFLGIMTVATLTVREAKSEEEKAHHEQILDSWDPDRLVFKEGSPYVGGSLTNEEYVMLQKPWKWKSLKSHKVYEFLEPHVNPSVEDAERLLAKAKAEANPKEEGVVGKPYWILTWRVNEEGIKKAQFPVPTACTPEEFAMLEYKSSPYLIQHETLDDYTTNLGLDLEDLNPTRTVEMHIETNGVVILSTEGLSQSLGLRADDVIVGVNYTPLTKGMTSTKLTGIIAEMPMPFVLNVSRKVRDYVPDSLDIEKNKQRMRDDLARFNKLLLLLALLVAGFALSVTATSSTEWTVYGRDPTSLADYGIGIWFAHIAKSMDRHPAFSLALDRLVFCGKEGNALEMDDDDGFNDCHTSRGNLYQGTDIHTMKIMTRVCTLFAVSFGLVGCFLITLLLLVGVETVSPKIRKRYVTWASLASLLQAMCSLIGAYCWTFVHESIKAKDDNCLVEYVDGTVAWVPRENGIAVTTMDYHDPSGTPLCLAHFRYGPAFSALVVAGVFTFLLSLDSLLSFTVYEDNLTVKEKMDIAKAKLKRKEKLAKFEAAADANENLDHGSLLSPSADKFMNSMGVNTKDVSESAHKAEAAMAAGLTSVGSSLRRMGRT